MSDIGDVIEGMAMFHTSKIKEAMNQSRITWKLDTTTSPRPDYLRGAFDGTVEGYKLITVCYHCPERGLELFEAVAVCSGPPTMVLHLPKESAEELYRNAEAKMN